MRRILLFSDVDGTLLDSDGRYAVTAEELASVSDWLTVVLASSRSLDELVRIQLDLGLNGPLVAENGAVVAVPDNELLRFVGARVVVGGRPFRVRVVGREAKRVRHHLRTAAASLGCPFVAQVTPATDTPRLASVLIRPTPGASTASLEVLQQALQAGGLSVASGGRWIAVTDGADKGVGARVVSEALRRSGHRYDLVAAVGDDDNDLPLLGVADRRFVIASADGHWRTALVALPGAERVVPPGILGWRAVLRELAAYTVVPCPSFPHAPAGR